MQDDLESLWKASQENVEGSAMLEVVKKKSEEFERTVRRRNLREFIACILVLVCFLFVAWKSQDVFARAGAILVALSAVWIAWYLHRFGCVRGHADPAKTLTDYKAELIGEYDKQIRLLRSVKFWYLAPMYVGLLVMTFGVHRSRGTWLAGIFSTILFTVVFGWIWWLNQVEGVKKLQQMKQALGAVLIALLMAGGASGQGNPAMQKAADTLVQQINVGDARAIWHSMNDAAQQALPVEGLQQFLNGMTQQLGKIERLEAPDMQGPSRAVYPAVFTRGKLDMTLALGANGKVAGLLFTPPKPAIAVVEKHETAIGLPFRGKWMVFWGGGTKEQNAHHDVRNQKWAFDLLGIGEDGKTRKGAANTNEDYYAFGREVLAPADGVVTDVIEGVRDNVPGSLNPYSALGNAVLIEHRNGEVSVLAHFQQGSIVVKVGHRVKRGQMLGKCGNSGNSSEPHIHYHLQQTPVIQDGTGIQVFFDKVNVGGAVREHYSPVKGDVLMP